MANRPVFYDPSGQRRRVFTGVSATVGLVLAVAGTIFVFSLLAVPFLPKNSGLSEPRLRRSLVPQVPRRQNRLSRFLLRRSRLALWKEVALDAGTPVPMPTTPAAPEQVVAAFYAPWEETGLNSLRVNASHLTHLVPAWLQLNHDGGGFTTADWNPALNRYTNDVVQVARANHVRICPLLSNAEGGNFAPERVHRLLISSRRQKQLSQGLVAWLRERQFQGLNLDFENLAQADYLRLPAFLKVMGSELRAAGLSLSVEVEAQSPMPLRPLADVCDFVVLMAYDEHYEGGEPGPIASTAWTYKVMERALKQIPANKLVIGIGNYSYDWSENKKQPTESLTYQSALFLASDNNQDKKPEDVIDFDNDALNSDFDYEDEWGNQHQVWMLDAISAYNQWLLARQEGVRGGALWVLGSEDPDLWKFFSRQALSRPVHATGLAQVLFPYEVDFQGEGELLQVVGWPREGRRQITLDPRNGLCTDMSYSSFPSPYVIRRTGYHKGLLALTFDDGPSAEFSGQILDELQRLGVPATFFVIGENAERYPRLVRRMWDEGHEVGNHTFTHPNLGAVSPRRLDLELNTTQRALEAIIGHSTTLFRAPYNADAEPQSGEEVVPLAYASQLGYVTVGELIDPQDWNLFKTTPTGALVTRTLEDVKSDLLNQVHTVRGNVILLHDGGGDRSRTVEALNIIVPELQRQGYKFVTVSKLMNRTRAQVMPPVSSKDRLRVGFDRIMFDVIFNTEFLLTLAFLGAIGLGIGRIIIVTPLACIETLREGKRVYEPAYQPLVTVMIAAFNEQPVIERTVRSILSSDYPRLEVVAVDDGSTDGTGDQVERSFANEPRVRLVRQANGGKAAALNTAIAHANGEILVGFDADTQVAPDAISLLVRHFSDPTVAAVAGNVKVGNRDNVLTKWQAVEYITSQNLDRRAYAYLNAITVVPGAIGAWRRDAVLEAGGCSSDTLAEDMDLTWRLRRAGYRITTDSQAHAYTEAPDTVKGFFKQRYRWAYGTLQCLYKHRKALFHHGWFGWLALPALWLFQVLVQLLAPFVDLQMLYSLGTFVYALLTQGILRGDWQPLPDVMHMLQRTAFFYAIFFTAEMVGAIVACLLDGEQLSLLWWLVWQRFVYRQMMYAVIWKSLWNATAGLAQGWGKLQRKGTVKIPEARG